MGNDNQERTSRSYSRRQVLTTAMLLAGAQFTMRISPASADDFGSLIWQPFTFGIPIAGIAFRLGTGADDLKGNEGLSQASSVTASVLVMNSDRQVTIKRQLNGDDEGWPPNSVHDKWFSLTNPVIDTIVAENIRQITLQFDSAQDGPFADNWDLSALSLFVPRTGTLPEPPFDGTLHPADFTLLVTGSGSPWLHRFKTNPDSEGGPDLTSDNPQWNPVHAQRDWRWCNRCQGLFFAGNSTTGACPAGGGHDYGGSGNYALLAYGASAPPPPPGVQWDWSWCSRCQGLFFAGRFPPRPCPAGGDHLVGSGSYTPFWGDGVAGSKQGGWRWCRRCQGMFFLLNSAPHRPCPAGGDHDATGSGNFMISFTGREP